jgi:hypothetical protein
MRLFQVVRRMLRVLILCAAALGPTPPPPPLPEPPRTEQVAEKQNASEDR